MLAVRWVLSRFAVWGTDQLVCVQADRVATHIHHDGGPIDASHSIWPIHWGSELRVYSLRMFGNLPVEVVSRLEIPGPLADPSVEVPLVVHLCALKVIPRFVYH